MAKDALGYHHARRHASGAAAVEHAIGITTACSCSSSNSSSGASTVTRTTSASLHDKYSDSNKEAVATALQQRPIALLKWSFDDYIVEEVLPPCVLAHADALAAQRASDSSSNVDTGTASSSSQQQQQRSLLVRVVSEGLPDTTLLRALQQRCPAGTAPLQMLTPIDFVCSSSRYVWVRSAACRDVFAAPQLLRVRGVPVHVDAALEVDCSTAAGTSSSSSSFPLSWLPDVRYTVVLRGVRCALIDVLSRLRSLMTRGFVNYSHLARHGVGALRAFEDGRRLLHRDYVPVMQQYARSLTEGAVHVQRELPVLLDALAGLDAAPPALHSSSGSSSSHGYGGDGAYMRDMSSSWPDVRRAMEHALQCDAAVMDTPHTGLYAPHHALLREFVTRVADVAAPTRHRAGSCDAAAVLRQCVSRRVLQEKLHSVAEVHYNALASLRWSEYGDRVVVGDLVMDDDSGDGGGDLFEGAADHVNGGMTSEAHPDWLEHNDAELAAGLRGSGGDGASRVRVVRTQAEADACSLHQVVLPLYGRALDELPALPQHRAARWLHDLARELQVEGLPHMRMAPRACYRHLLRRPRDVSCYLVHEERGWDWCEGTSALRASMYTDSEGVARMRSPLATVLQQQQQQGVTTNVLARRGIRGDERRTAFVRPARKPGMLCVLQMTLPRGSPVTSALREVFQVTTLSPSAIYRLLL